MNPRIEGHFAFIEGLLLESPAVRAYQVTKRLVGPTDGKLRIKVELSGGGKAEFFEYLVATPEVRIVKYSFHCQTASGTLLKRWDNAPHFPEMPNVPHHVHLADGAVIPAAQPPDIAAVLLELEQAGMSGQGD